MLTISEYVKKRMTRGNIPALHVNSSQKPDETRVAPTIARLNVAESSLIKEVCNCSLATSKGNCGEDIQGYLTQLFDEVNKRFDERIDSIERKFNQLQKR